MRIVGLTGGIATGKSTVVALLLSRGIPVIDCDKIAYDVVQSGRWGYRRVVAAMGKNILLNTGEIDRDALMQRVFSDAAARRKLNAATHLPIGLEILRQLTWHWLCHRCLVVVDMPLLIETGAYRFTWPRVLVYCPPDCNLERLMKRDDCSKELAGKKIAAQVPLDAKRKFCQHIIDNSGSREETQMQVEAVVRKLLRNASWQGALTSPSGLLALVCAAVTSWLRFR